MKNPNKLMVVADGWRSAGARVGGVVLALAVVILLGSCGMLGKGTKEADYKIPEKSRILVFVDPRASCPMPADGPALLGEMLTQHLYTYKVGDSFVDQSRLTGLRKEEEFRKLGIADVAKKTDADIVLYVDVVSFVTQEVSEGQVSQGAAQVLVKIIDKNGKRLWPAETAALGAPVEVRVDPNFSEESNTASVQGQLYKLLAMRVGRMFHSYDLEDRNVNQ